VTSTFDEIVAPPRAAVHRGGRPTWQTLALWYFGLQAGAAVSVPTWWFGWHLMDRWFGWIW